jgi:glycosyltransferase involved in cell wall biosynthesis
MMRGEPDRRRGVDLLQQPRQQPTHWARVPVPRVTARRVTIVGPSRASIAVTVGSLIHDIAQRGHHVTCFAPELGDAAATQALSRLGAELRGLPAFRQGFSPLADQLSVARLTSAFRALRPDVVAGYSPKGALLAGIAGRMAGAENIVSMIAELGRGFEEGPERPSKFKRHLQKTLLRLALGLSHTAVFFNEENHKLLHLLDLIPERLREFPMNGSGIDLERFPMTPLPPLDRGIMFLYAGPLDKRFGIREFCEAARRLTAKPGNYKCMAVGPETAGPNAFPLAALKRYRNCVQYLGPKADPRPFLARTHVFVLPARGDAIPQALLEAIAMGRPVITSTARGCRVVVREDQNGMIVPPGDAAALASAMARLLLRPDLIPSMARASREIAQSQFDSRRINGLLLSAFDL